MDGRAVRNCFPPNLSNDKDLAEGKKVTYVNQFVSEVVDFSSQYGSDSSISYTAYNLSGKPSNYPDYGDFPQAFVMKTYGNWWRESPSCPEEYMPQNNPAVTSSDYVDMAFEQAVFPRELQVFETYNPGAVVRVWALDAQVPSRGARSQWALLWEGPPQRALPQPRIFAPPLNCVHFKTRLVRIEFNHSLLNYYTGIDAVLLVGTLEPAQHPAPAPARTCLASPAPARACLASPEHGRITQQVIQLNLHNIPFQPTDLKKVLSDYKTKTYCATTQDCQYAVTLECLPHETMLKILGYLDLRSLCQVAQVSRSLNDLATDELLFARLSLRPYWSSFCDEQLLSLAQRCRRLQRLDLSWCGNYGLISSQVFNRFVSEWCTRLTHIRLNCCKFVGNGTVKALAETCPGLRELALRNCAAITEAGFLHLTAFSRLTSLDLYRTLITGSCLVPILQANPLLEHLNIGSCTKIENMDEVARTLGSQNRHLVSLDLWKTVNLSQVGVRALSQCTDLQELDLGWCLGLSVPVESLTSLARGCPRLRKLFLTALRGICDKDLEPFVTACPGLEQIDLLGVHSITPDGCMRLLVNLQNLRFLDLSFCYQISDATVANWRRLFPHVAIKRSTQADLTTLIPALQIDGF